MLFISSKKSSFRSRDIQIFIFLFSPLFCTVGHCLRDWSKIHLKVYGVINSLKKNLITNFVLCLEKEKRYDVETLLIHRVLDKEKFLWKIHAEKVHQKPVPDPFLIFINNPKQPLHERNCFKNIIFWKRITKKPLKS